ncbi:MAG: hypothetical protein JWR63_3344 [Conexibacter sp.]|nr:hypothetical protein [Conexibacter sp.]
MLAESPYLARVVSRMLDFFAVNEAWQRRLWTPGAALTLDEIIEAADGVRDRALSQSALNAFTRSVRSKVGTDPGLGDDAQRRELSRVIGTDLVASSERHEILRHIAADVHERYIPRWAVALAPEHHNQQAERVARLFAGHLLDVGYSQDHLHRWLTYLRDHDPSVYDRVGLATEVQRLVERKPKRFRVLALFETAYPSDVTPPEEWLERQETETWLVDRGLAHLAEGVMYRGSLQLRLKATDAEAAVALAGDIVDALIARAAIGTRRVIIAHRYALVAGERDRRFPLRRRRRVEVRAVERQDRLADDLYSMVQSPVDAAIQLLSHLDTGPRESAVGGAWSAIESLLTAPGDEGGNVVAGDRLAALVACSWPRAELTTLAGHRMREVDDDLSGRLREARTNRDRAELIGGEITAGTWLQMADPSDLAAIKRMEKFFAHPAQVLRDIESYASDSLRRLYRQRNLVLHGGNTTAIALRATLRTVAPLIGAGMDRVVHAHLEAGVEPLELAARARLELARVGTADGRRVTRLLEAD